MYKICFYAPETHVDKIKNAMFAKGAGKIGDYCCCAWQTLGEGQFMPLDGSNPFIGNQNQLEKVVEYKVEMICDDAHIHAVIDAMKQAHPYEEPAYFVFKAEKF